MFFCAPSGRLWEALASDGLSFQAKFFSFFHVFSNKTYEKSHEILILPPKCWVFETIFEFFLAPEFTKKCTKKLPDLYGSGVSKHVLGTCREVHDVFFFVWGLALHLILPPVLDACQGGGPGRSGIGPASSRGRQMVSHHRRLAVGHRAWLHTTIGLSHDACSAVTEK